MPFKRTASASPSSINAVTIGTGDNAMTLGGENTLPFYTFDAPVENKPRIGFQISDLGVDRSLPGIAAAFEGAESITDIASRAAKIPGVDFICLTLEGADPGGADKSIEDCVAVCKEVSEAIDIPLVVEGCRNAEKDGKLFEKVAEALQGKNILLISAREENYKSISVAACLAYGQKLSAESAVDINLAKQLNVMINQMGIQPDNIAMNVGAAAAGYGFEYVSSTMDRIRSAALGQNDQMLQMPVVTPVASEAWGVKESVVSEEDFPEWGPREQRGINMEIATAAACLTSASNAVILKHPASVAAISKFIAELV